MSKNEDFKKQLKKLEKEYSNEALKVAQLYERYDGTVPGERNTIGTALGDAVKRFREVGVKKRMLEEKVGRPGQAPLKGKKTGEEEE